MDIVCSFIGLACLISWVFWAPLVYGKFKKTKIPGEGFWYFIGGIGPVFSAVYHSGGGLPWLWSNLKSVYALPDVYDPSTFGIALAVAAIFISGYCGMQIYRAIGGYPTTIVKDKEEVSATGFTMPMFVFGGGFSMVIIWMEEIGWRGFMLPILMERYHDMYTVTVICGLVWTLWHFPLYLFSVPLCPASNSSIINVVSVVAYSTALTSVSMLMSVMYMCYGQAHILQFACIIHASFNGVIAAFNPKYLRMSMAIVAAILVPLTLTLGTLCVAN